MPVGESQTYNLAVNKTTTGDSNVWHVEEADQAKLEVINGATNSVTMTFLGSLDGTNYVTMYYRANPSATYVNTALVVTGGSTAMVDFAEDDLPPYIKANISVANANGTSIIGYAD